MSEWNNDYKHKPYGTYGGYRHEDDRVLMWLVALVFSAVLGLAVFTGLNTLADRYGTEKVATYCFLGFVGFIFLSGVVYAVWVYITELWDKWFGLPYMNSYAYNTGNTTNKATNTTYKPPKQTFYGKAARAVKPGGLLENERQKAPRAQFFGRLDGTAVESVGKYEERWLNTYEYTHWLKQNERKQALEAGLVDENPIQQHHSVNTTTKIDF